MILGQRQWRSVKEKAYLAMMETNTPKTCLVHSEEFDKKKEP